MVTEKNNFRLEYDSLGEAWVPKSAYYGIQTQRASENFNITGFPIGHYPELIRALAMVKQAATRSNRDLALLPADIALVIDKVCQEIIDGQWHDQFIVDLIQGGAGTSCNMNANEVITNRALECMGFERGDYTKIHPNNHLNCSQSTNDVYPTAVRLATIFSTKPLIDTVHKLRSSLDQKAVSFSEIVKMGRTQLQDAVPMTLGQEFHGFSVTLFEDTERLAEVTPLLSEVNLGGTAIGTGINTHQDYAGLAIDHLSKISGERIVAAEDKIEATSDMGAFLSYSAILKRLAVKLSKICNDLRLLSSGPRTGLGEINLPAMQPGSSIMPGKVNPVIPEAVNQACFQVIANDLAVTLAAEAGQLQLNAMEPLIAYNILNSIRMLTRSIKMFDDRCISGIEANKEHCANMVHNSIGIITVLTPYLGYDDTARIANKALLTNRSVIDLVLAEKLMDEAHLRDLLRPSEMLSS